MSAENTDKLTAAINLLTEAGYPEDDLAPLIDGIEGLVVNVVAPVGDKKWLRNLKEDYLEFLDRLVPDRRDRKEDSHEG